MSNYSVSDLQKLVTGTANPSSTQTSTPASGAPSRVEVLQSIVNGNLNIQPTQTTVKPNALSNPVSKVDYLQAVVGGSTPGVVKKTPSVTTVTGSHKSGKFDAAPSYEDQLKSLQTRLDVLKKRRKQLEIDNSLDFGQKPEGWDELTAEIGQVERKINDVETQKYDEKIKSKFDKNLTTTDRRSGEKKTTGENLIDLYTQYEKARKSLTAEQTMNLDNRDASSMPDDSEVNALRKKIEAYGLSKKDEASLREYVNRQIRAEEAAQSNATAKALAEQAPGLASTVSVPMNLMSGLGTVEVAVQNARNAVRKITGQDALPIDYNTMGMNLARDTQTIRGTVAEDIDKKYGKVASFAYQTGMSMADSLATMAVSAMGAPTMLSSSLLGGSAATNGILEAKKRGATDTQALFVGLANGVFETLFEDLSLEKLLSTSTPDTLGKALLNIVTQAFTEGTEEVNTSIANTLADLIIMGDKSEFEQMKAAYINADYEEAEAQKLAAQEWAQGLLMDFIGGAVSGGIFGSAANITTNIRAAQIGDTMTFDEINTLVDEAKQYDGVNGAKQAVKMASDIESGKTYVTKRVAGRLYEEVSNAREAAKNNVSPAASQNVNAVEQARTETAAINPNSDVLDTATTAFVKMGMSLKTAKAKADVVARLVAGESVTNREINTLDPTSKKIQKAFSELTGVTFPDGKIDRNRLYGLYRSASELAEQARQDAKMDQVSASQAESTATEVVRQVMQNAQIEQQTEQQSDNAATEEPSTAVAPSEPTITMSDGGMLTKSEFIEAMRKQPGTEDMTDEQLSGFFDHAVAQNITMNRSTEGENTNGRNTLSDEGLQRADGPSSAEQAAGVEGSARTSEADMDTGAGSRENAAAERAESESAAGSEESGRNLETAKKVRSLNLKTSRIGHKSGNADVSYNEVHTYEREKIEGYKEAEEEAKAHGVKLTPVIGLIEGTTTVDGKSFDVSANGMHEPGKVWARADDPDMSFHQSVKHEIYHEEVENDAGVRAAHEGFVETMRKDPFIDQLVKLAYDDVSGAYGVSLGEYDANASGYYEELCADISADYDRIPGMDPLVKDILRSVFAESMSGTRAALDVGETVITADNTSTEPATKMSIVSLSDASGVQVDKDENGKIIFKVDGKQVNEINADHIKNKSGLGALIKVAEQDGRISGDEAKNQYKMAADIMNMIMETQDPETVWAVAGASMFSAVKSNSDGQYGTTIDFSTVCRKTQNMINAMSEVMTTERRGLTKDEVTRLQKDLIEEGSDVPCPVCYVFSRWAGIGGILENMYKWQNKYDGYTAEQLQSRVEELSDKLGKGKAKDLKKFLREQDERYDFLEREIYRLSRDKTNPDQSRKELASAKKELDAIKKSVAPELAWLKQVRMMADYETKGKVNPDILFDMNRAAEFAEYSPLAWTYRTTRGPSAGKAILPYSDMRLGDLILGVKNTSADGNQTFKTVENGKFNEEQKAAIVKAIARTKAQNLIGGQRYQSTSDFRYDYALDYLQSFWEAQALGSNMQTYTKIVEFADMVAAVGGDANLSVMPKNKGYVELPDGSKRLIFSSVTGMDFDVAKEASQKHDNVQLILVGINDEHIKLALQESEETGGAYIGFVIPYHASGASINEFISALVSNLNEKFMVEYYQDYSKAQTDSVKGNTTADQNRRRSLRSAILKGTVSTKDAEGKTHTTKWEPSAEDLAFIQGENVDISDRSFDDLRDVELRALGGDENAIREYESWTAGALADIYNKLWVDEDSKYKDVRLNSAQAETVMPHEYWNTSVDREHAYINGFLFRSYCYNLGLKPRFSGITEKGKTYGDFTSEAGYWKTLIDRPMYDNRGQYRDQQAINVSGFKQDMLTSDYGEREWAGHVIANPDPAKAHNAAQKFMARETQKAVALSNEANFENRTLAAQRERNESSDTQSKFSLRKEDPPKKTGIAYKVFLAVDGKLYPPMVANPGGAETPVGVWLNADAAPRAADSKTGRPQVQAGGKGTNTGKTQLAYRPGWHLGDVPVAKQFAKVNPETGQKELFPANFVWAECEYAADADYQDEAMSYGYTENGKFRHSYAGLPRVPENGFYRYRTNPNPDTVPWVITGAMKVNKILNDDEVAEICKANGVEPMQRMGGPINLEALGFGEKVMSKFSAAQIDQEAQDRNNNEQFRRFIDSLDKDYGAGMGEKMMAAFTSLDASRKAAAAAAAETYGMIPQGEAPTREARIPAQMNDKTKVHKTVRTVVEAEATPESRLPDIGSAVVDGKLSYTPKTNKIAVNKAEAKLKNGWRQAVDSWKKDVYSGKVSAELVALGAEILNNAGNAEDSKVSGAEYTELLVDYCDLLKRAGQSVQAAKILKKLTPSAKLYGLQRVVQKYNDLEEVQKRIPDGVALDPTLVDRYNKARTDAERDMIMDELTQDIADQLPATWTDRLTALRYLNMLGNFKTQIRNVVGNAVFQPVRLVKDGVKVVLEFATGAERTTSFTWNKETYLDCLDDFDSFADEVMSGGKYKPGAKIDADIEEKRQIFGKTGIRAWDKTLGRGLEAYRKATNWAMDKGDVVFCKATYADAMAKYLKAKKTTFQNASEEMLDSARAYAIRQAAEATYRDNNQFSDFISRIRVRNPDTATAKAAYAVTEGVLTFRKTPANILVRAVEYSPIGLLTTSFQAMQDVKNNTTYENGKRIVGKVDTAKLIENLAKNITGVGIVALGYALSQQSLFKKIKLVGAGSDDDKEKDFDVLTGHQDYCIELPNGLTFTLDWLAPECIPLFIGANLSEQVMRDGWSFKAGLDAIGRITDPMLEMSMLSGLDDAFKNAQTYGDDKALPRFVENALWSYFTQFTTNTLLGQVARALTNTSYATYIDKNSQLSSDQQKMIGKFLAKVPMSPEKKFGQIPRIDAWGRIQTNYENETKNIIGQFFNPAYTSRVNESDVDKELRRLYKSTKESVFPDKANTYFNVTVDGKSERLNLSAEQYMEYAMEKGSTSYTLLEQAMKQPYYKSLSDKEKADFVNDLYKYADQLAKAKVSGNNLSGEAPNGSYSPDSWVMEAYEAKGKGIQVCDYINAKNVTAGIKSLKDANGKSISNTSGLQKMQAIYAMGFTQSQCEYLFEAFGVGKTVIGYSSSEVNAALKDLQAKAR